MTKTDIYQAYCRDRAAVNRVRTLKHSIIAPHGRLIRDGQTLVNFASNDYLGLSQHPALIAGAQDYAARFGAGTTASRLITGNHPAYEALEQQIATGKNKAAALIMSSGYQTNLTVIAALADKDVAGKPVTIIADRLAHHSLLQGALLSGARLVRFHHNDYDHLGSILDMQAAKGHFSIIVSESVFGMDGDRADLAALGQLAKSYDALLYIDEAHATGVFGAHGFGLAADHPDSVDVVMGTFGKALGSFGSYIGCPTEIRDYLIQRCGGLVYSTGLPPAVLGSIAAALELVPQMDNERAALLAQGEHVRDTLTQQGWNCGHSTTQIIPIIVGAEKAALEIAATLLQEGFLVPAIRPPTVPQNTSRLRVSLSVAHQREDVTRFLDVMQKLAPVYNEKAA